VRGEDGSPQAAPGLAAAWASASAGCSKHSVKWRRGRSARAAWVGPAGTAAAVYLVGCLVACTAGVGGDTLTHVLDTALDGFCVRFLVAVGVLRPSATMTSFCGHVDAAERQTPPQRTQRTRTQRTRTQRRRQ